MKTFNKVYSKVRSKAMDKITKAWKSGGLPAYGDFELTVRTTANGETFTLPLGGGFNYNATVDWGDGVINTLTSSVDPDRIHPYATAGDHNIIISGIFESLFFNNAGDRLKILRVDNLGNVGWRLAGFIGAFYGCTNLVYFNGNGDISWVASLADAMRDWTSMTSPPDLSSWDVSAVTNLAYAMHGWTAMTSPPDLSSWDVSKVTSLLYAMYNWSSMTSPPDLSSWDVSKVTNLANAMQNWSSMGAVDPGISAWNVQSLTDGTSFMSGSQLTTAAYDATLENWSAQAVKLKVSIHFGNSQYTPGGAAEAGRNILTGTYNWTIVDGGPII